MEDAKDSELDEGGDKVGHSFFCRWRTKVCIGHIHLSSSR
jgi:hypothetical protein